MSCLVHHFPCLACSVLFHFFARHIGHSDTLSVFTIVNVPPGSADPREWQSKPPYCQRTSGACFGAVPFGHARCLGQSLVVLLFGNLGKQFWKHAAAHLQGNMFRILPRQNLTIWRPHIARKYFQSFVVTELYNLVNFHAAHLQESQIRILQRQDFTI